jgi:hypothetical protein
MGKKVSKAGLRLEVKLALRVRWLNSERGQLLLGSHASGRILDWQSRGRSCQNYVSTKNIAIELA